MQQQIKNSMETPKVIQPTLSSIASKYIGFQETPNNSGFKDKVFEQRMKNVGWDKGQAWCCYFAELCVIEWATAIGRKDIVDLAKKTFSGGSTATYKNFEMYATANPNGIAKVSKKPTANSVAIYRHGSGWQGHTAVVKEVLVDKVSNIEGNTNSQGGREGIEVASKKRLINAPFSANGLNIVGYISFK